jgi:hypothetical protein
MPSLVCSSTSILLGLACNGTAAVFTHFAIWISANLTAVWCMTVLLSTVGSQVRNQIWDKGNPAAMCQWSNQWVLQISLLPTLPH